MQIPLIRAGNWKYGGAPVDTRLAEVQREILNFAGVARAYNIAVCLQNLADDYVGAAVWDYDGMLRGIDPRWVGYDFDPGSATLAGGPDGAAAGMRVALQRLKAVTVSDAAWSKEGSRWKAAPCPLGEGSVDWQGFFGSLARAKFNGPLTIQMRYQPKDELAAIRKDLDFVRKQIAAAYGSAG
jgi:sugar phosphate isomerase/epimerase